jgi:hypothetical protein
MIYNYKQYESIFFKSVDDKLSSIEDLIAKLKTCKEDINVARNKHLENPRYINPILGNVPLHKFNAEYRYFFKTRDKVLDEFNSLFEFTFRKNFNQKKINSIVDVWKDFESTIPYGSYSMSMDISKKYANSFIVKANDFLETLDELKNEYDIDLDTKDPFVLTKRNGNFVTPSRKSFDEERILNLKNKYWEVDPLGEEDWED